MDALLDKLDELSGVSSHVLAFAKKVRENLESLPDDEHYTAFYVGETTQTFLERMSVNYPIEFLSAFPATHMFKLSQVKPGTRKDLCKYAPYAMEAFVAVWLENKLGDVSHFSGRFLNFEICGYRSFLGPFGVEENYTYVSYEIESGGTYKPLVVHPTWKHVRTTYGDKGDMHAPKHNSYVAHHRVNTVFLRRFFTYGNTEEIQRLLDDAREAMGDARAIELRQIADLKHASRGICL